uniref:ubiquitinyl hydrolase 1 n=1 Tax=Hanseniaspora osmophila TaxID=56408 RepID=A0A1E5RHD3_9ASCO
MQDKITDLIDLGKPVEELFPKFNEYETEIEGGFTWEIDNWNALEHKHVSPGFQLGGYSWNVLLFPNGNNSNKYLAVYIEPKPQKNEKVIDGKVVEARKSSNQTQEISNKEEEEAERLQDEEEEDDDEEGEGEKEEKNSQDTDDDDDDDDDEEEDWSVCAQFFVVISRPGQNSVNIVRSSHHRFNKTETDWGFSDYAELDKLKTKYSNSKNLLSTGLIVEGKTNISVYVRIIKDETGVLWHNFVNYNSKKVTGFVGLNNQGATCYLNSLLQTYFFTKKFRKMVYAIPTAGENPSDSVALALQRAFYLLETSDVPLDTLELTKSFGWDTGDAFTQHDVQELNRILMDKLESKMSLGDMFVGKMKSYIKCINIDYESSRIEDFWDIQLNVKDMKNLEQSFQNYIEVETLDGENQYQTEGYGLQDAEKGVIFESFPPVLYLQLKRFEYDFNFDRLIKINDRYEFPESIDLSPYGNGKVYDLHAVLVHSGDIDTGHYYAMIKPSDDQWYRFDDDRVWRVSKSAVFDDNFGCNKLSDEEIKKMSRLRYQNYLIRRQTSAYMLVYIEREAKEDVFVDVSQKDFPKDVVNTLAQEREEEIKRKLDIEEMRSYYKISVVSEKDFCNYEGFDIFPNTQSKLYHPDLYDSKPLELKVLKTSTVRDLKKKIGCKRLWLLGYRQTHTLRLYQILNEDDASLESSFKKFGFAKCLDAVLYADNSDEGEISDDQVLLFIKVLKSDKQIKGHKALLVDKTAKISEIYQQVAKKVQGLLPFCYEEISPNEIQVVDTESTVFDSELLSGDILTFGVDTNIQECYEYLRYRLKLNFSSSSAKSEFVKPGFDKEFGLWVSVKCTFEELAQKCAAELQVDWRYLKLIACYENGRFPLHSQSSLDRYVLKNFSFANIPPFEYEVLSIPLVELENLKAISVKWLSDNYIHYSLLEFKMPSSSTVADLKKKLLQRVGKESSDLLLWTNVDHKFQGKLSDDTILENINEIEICARIMSLKDDQKLVVVVQYFKTLNKTHGISFLFELVPGENIKDMTKRLHTVFGLGQKEFSKIKLSLYSHATRKWFNLYDMSEADQLSTVAYDLLDSSDVLFMDHPDRSRTVAGDRPMTIK